MTIDYRHGISILEIIVYSPTLFVALWMAFHHGFKKSSGWYFFVVFSLARIVGAACYLATIAAPSEVGLYIAWAVCTLLGLSPLILGCLGLLSRANDSIMRKTGNAFSPIIFRFVVLVSLVALILSIVGSTQNSDITHGSITTESKVALVLFLITWLAVCGLFLLIASRSHSIEDGERRLLLAVGISLPLILVRLVYSFVYAFGHLASFNMLSGNVTIQLVMSVLEEIVIVFICLGIGLTLQVRPSAEYTQQTSVSSHQDSQVELESGVGQSQAPQKQRHQRPKRGGGPIARLVMFIVDEIKERRR
ncbi:unnamed protein product [Penicillium salamii]|uniref:DUF7702 domain-containing protein n=1 Tax=Penicillium salamii TaxID=1612424 RepID=A0A9W4J2W4_9EURO|nr:unnamed protein product [Penicillium salamii]CAG8356315.1 unnamed protein product [Penicillium salamii]CAG8369007.1 unnamed protein product [Penicillium salamii]CAG8394117.1 unnamed protein product [Penicillium salamii]